MLSTIKIAIALSLQPTGFAALAFSGGLAENLRKVEVPVENIIKLDANENPYGCSARVSQALATSMPTYIFSFFIGFSSFMSLPCLMRASRLRRAYLAQTTVRAL